MKRQKENSDISTWRFRREISMGTLLHVIAIVITIAAAWSNLQKEFALVRHDLNQLITSNTNLQKHIQKLAGQCTDHEYRIKTIEQRIQHDKIFPDTVVRTEQEKADIID